MHAAPAVPVAVRRARTGAGGGRLRWGIKIYFTDEFYHIPLAKCSMKSFAIYYDGCAYVFARLPMGLSIAPSETQHFACATAKLVESEFPGLKGIAYLDDFLFVSRQANELIGVYEFFVCAGLRVSVEVCFVSCVATPIH